MTYRTYETYTTYWTLAVASLLALASNAPAAELARFEIKEPVGQNWTDEWLTQEVAIDLSDKKLEVGELQLVDAEGTALPVQFFSIPSNVTLKANEELSGKVRLKVFFNTTIKKSQTATFALTDSAAKTPPWPAVEVAERASKVIISNGIYEVEFDSAKPLPVSSLRCGDTGESLGRFRWPDGATVTKVEQTISGGPAQAIIKQTFHFADPNQHYEITFDCRAGDPWIGVHDRYALGEGTAIELDLRPLNADVVYHPHTYNARTFKPDGKDEDSTLEPPQDPIATLGPIWRDIWYGGGPMAYVYNSTAGRGIGFAAVRGSEWTSPDDITLESQNLEIHGDPEKTGQVCVRIPTDEGERQWAIILGPPDVRKNIGRMIRSHADIPLDRVLKEWILEWDSDAPEVRNGNAGVYLGSHYNKHFHNPTTYPRSVRGAVNRLMEKDHVKSPGLAMLAYIFTDPNYWPGPRYRWKINNPNFHTDMYNIPLKIAALMPDHPHAGRWLQYGLEETKGDLMRNSYPGGAWQESLSYSAYAFHMIDNAKILRDAGAVNPFKEWPRIREVLTYLACMHTPVDPRYGSRQKAPIGDTSPGNYIEQLRGCADLYRGVDDGFAEQLARFPEAGPGAFDLGSRELYGFGAMMRGNAYDERNESFVTVKAGPARNHYQGDELSFYFASLGTPLAIDHACHYSPRPWSASMHNRPDMNGKRPVALGVRRAMETSEAADVFVADERTVTISHVPMEPHNTTKPGYKYPRDTLPEDKAWTMRRYAMLVKHDPKRSKIADYLVIRDEIESPEPVWWNLHVLGCDIKRDGDAFHFPGQLDVDLTAYFIAPNVGEIEEREWGWADGKSADRRRLKGAEYEAENFGAWIPENFEKGRWKGGEMSKWLRVKGEPGHTDWLVVLMPNLQGRPAPKVERLSPTSAQITLGDETEIVHLGSDAKHQAAVERNGKATVLISANEVKPWSALEFKPFPPNLTSSAR